MKEDNNNNNNESVDALKNEADVIMFVHLSENHPKVVHKIFSQHRREELAEIRDNATEPIPKMIELVESFQVCRKRQLEEELGGIDSDVDDTSDSDDKPAPKKAATIAKTEKKAESSDSDSDDEPAPKKVAAPAKAIVKTPAKKAESSSDSDSDDKPAPKKVAAPVKAVVKTPAKKAESSSDSDSDDAPAPKKVATPAKAVIKTPAKKAESSDSDSDDKPTTVNENGKGPVKRKQPGSSEESEEKPAPKMARKSNEPFRRVQLRRDEVGEKFRDNSFDGAHDEWGRKAFNDLKKTQGKSFRHEKTKKKRGSYSGGKISTTVNSVPFDDDSN